MLKNAYVKAKVVGYDGSGEYWVIMDNNPAILIDGANIVDKDSCTQICPEELNYIFTEILNTVNLPNNIKKEIERLNKIAVN